ncbi:MAG: glycoside hydrolase family 43 protein [Mobilitalea sp.]
MRARVPNPILPGFYPDPSICRVGDDYYLVTSTFAYFPGVPIFHSKDLIHWEQIGNVLDREEQINLLEADLSGGIFAPTLRFNNGTFYMITTNVSHGGNFIVIATDPAGPWSNPYFLEGAEGIDPSLFFDDDGKCYYTGTKARREGAKFFGDNEIWVQEVDLETMRLVGDSYALWNGALRAVEWPEGPHLYKKDGKYYLLIAEAGTSHAHAITIASGTSLREPFRGYNCNPILTHRHLGHDYPIVNVGHGDLVETQKGEWYMVTLASRQYGGYYRNLGRETFLVPVIWENGWPVVNKGIGLLEDTVEMPDLEETPVAIVSEKEDFDNETLPYHFIYLRNPRFANYSLTERKGYLRMKLAREKILDLVSPSYVAVRQTGMCYQLETLLEFTPENKQEEAGLVLLQNNRFHYRLVSTIRNGIKVIQLVKCFKGEEEVLARVENEDMSRSVKGLRLRITAKQQYLQFAYSYDGKSYHIIKADVDGRILSTDVAGGFVGTTVGLYCSSNGGDSNNIADFDWISYKNL